jgi:hypothetical protein
MSNTKTSTNTFVFVTLFATLASCNDAPKTDAVAPPETLLLSLADLGVLNRPAVLFDHAAHVEAVATTSGCPSCHRPKQVFDVTAAANASDKVEAMEAFHEICLPCHRQEAGDKIFCASCHDRTKALPAIPAKTKAFSESLHEKHMELLDGKCDDCHHVYDKKLQKLVYDEGNETPCSNCHTDKTLGKRLSLKDASHRSCIECHQKLDKGPVRCSECHKPNE